MTRASLKSRLVTRGLAILLAFGLLTGCSGEDASTSTSAGTHYVVDLLARRLQATNAERLYRDLTEALPSVEYSLGGSASYRVSELAVLGEFVEAKPGPRFSDDYSGDDGTGSSIVEAGQPFDWGTVQATFAIETVLGQSSKFEGSTVEVGLAFGAQSDFDLIAEELTTLGELVLFLVDDSPVFSYEPSLWAVADNGALMVTVSPEGQLGLPHLSESETITLLGSGTLEDLIDAADRPRVIELTKQDGMWVRTDR